jgi:hypothetical protein
VAWESKLQALWTIAAGGVLGAFIDFYIGKPGQRRVRDWLETWWLRLSDVRWGNFGREEALFAVRVIDRLFGRRFFSIRRIVSVAVITFGSLCVMLSLFITKSIHLLWIDFISPTNIILTPHPLLSLIAMAVFVTASLSITRFAASQIAYVITKVPLFNFVGFTLLLTLQYASLTWWPSIVLVIHSFIASTPQIILRGILEKLNII